MSDDVIEGVILCAVQITLLQQTTCGIVSAK